MASERGGIRVVLVGVHSEGPSLPSPATETEFRWVRDTVLQVCARHGTFGPPSESVFNVDAQRAIRGVDFYVPDDYYGGDMRRVVVEPTASVLSASWIQDLADALKAHRGWGALVSAGEGISLLVQPGLVEIRGWQSGLNDLGTIVAEIRDHVTNTQNARRGQQERRLKEVLGLVPGAWRVSAHDGIGLVASFRTHSDGRAGDTVWLLHFEDASAFDLDDYTFEPDALRPSLYWVSKTGDALEYSPGSAPTWETGAALLAEWALVNGGKEVIETSRARVSKGKRTWVFDLLSH